MNQVRTRIVILSSLLLFSGAFLAHGQQAGPGTYAFITWRANNFYPSDFTGKALATNGSVINASVNLVLNQTLQDLSKTTITWYLDGSYFNQGTGANQINFTVTKSKGDVHSVRADLQTAGGIVSAAASIPVVAPRAVIVAPYPNLTAGPGNVAVKIEPFFFNVKSLGDLIFSWTVNGENKYSGPDNNLSLSVGASGVGTIPITARVGNKNNQLESAEDSVNLSINQ